MRIETFHKRSMTGMINRRPGSRTATTRPRRKCTPRSYCHTTRIDAINNSNAKTAAETVAAFVFWPISRSRGAREIGGRVLRGRSVRWRHPADVGEVQADQCETDAHR